jgi:hypothetical protein
MPARALYHDAVKSALIKDGWKITHDPLTLRWGRTDQIIEEVLEPYTRIEYANADIQNEGREIWF